MTDTLAAELREAAAAIERVAQASRCWSVISGIVAACTDHITAIAGNVEKNERIAALEAGRSDLALFDDPLAIIERTGLGPVERRVAVSLALRFGRWTTIDHLADAAYYDHPDGGPLDIKGTLAQVTLHLRRKLKPDGLTIQGVAYHGRRMVRI